MPIGEEIKDDFLVVKEDPTLIDDALNLPASSVQDCPYTLTVLADATGKDLQNDKSSVLFRVGKATTSIILYLQQKQGGVWVDVDTLNNNDVGEYFALGFIIDDSDRQYIGYLIKWNLVKPIHGEGIFRVKAVESTILGNITKYSIEWCLRTYTTERANETVRFDIITNSVRGDIADETDYVDFGSKNWYNSYRLCGMFGNDKSDYEREFVTYDNGEQQYITDKQILKYSAKLSPIPAWMHNIIKTEILQADEILITDYNKNNPNTHIKRPVKADGNYEPDWRKNTKLAPVSILFENRYDNMRKRRCTSDGSIVTSGASSTGGAGTVSENLKKGAIGITLDGGGSVINTGAYGSITMNYTGVIEGWDIFEHSDPPISGSIVIDVWKDTYPNYPPNVSDTIFGTKPSLSVASKNTGSGLAIQFNAGDIFRFNVDSVTSCKKVTLILKTKKS